MSHRLKAMIKHAGRGVGVAAALLVIGDAAFAQSRTLLQTVQADGPLAPAQRDELVPSQRGGVSLEQATAMAQSRFPGRVVRAEPVQMGDRRVYEIRILGDDNRVRIVRIDAQTGAFL
jgi:uncharacterized membrane protein YkoI